jgi:arsenate reductase-like glutaredoxin family protein
VVFYKEAESAYDIVELIDSPSEKVIKELEEKIKDLETIIEKLNDLINELIISSKDSKKSDDEIQNLFKDMDDLIDSVKKYE